jgi:hypothetical protein
MSYSNDPMGAALDRYITGNWGEDQFAGEEEWDATVERICGDCKLRMDCLFYTDGNRYYACDYFDRAIKDMEEEHRIADEECARAFMEQENDW